MSDCGVVEFLSPAWVAALDDALRAADVTVGERRGLVIQQLVEHPDGSCTAYWIAIDSAGAGVGTGHAADPTVTYRQSVEVARGIATGERNAHVEFLRGRLRLAGDATALLDYQDTLTAVAEALHHVRRRTNFPAPTADSPRATDRPPPHELSGADGRQPPSD